MTIEMKEFEELRKKFYESFAKEYGIKLKESDQEASTDGDNTEAAPPTPVNAEPTPVLPQPEPIAYGVAEDTSLQTTPLKDEGTTSFIFEQGNMPQLQNSLKDLIKKPGIITRTFLPLVEKALIELLGSSSSYRRSSFNFNISVLNNNIVYDIVVVYSVDLFIGTDIEQAAVEQDQNYILNTISVVPNMKIRELKIDTSTGLVRIAVAL